MDNTPPLSGTNLIEAAFLAKDQPVFIVGWETRRILAVNDAVYRVFGWRPEELRDRTTEMLHVNADSFKRFGSISETMLQSKRDTFHCSTRMLRRDGSSFDTENMLGIIRDRDGTPLAAVSVVFDLSEGSSITSPAEHSPDLSLLGDHLPGGVFQRIQRPNGDILYNFIRGDLAEQFGIDPEQAKSNPELVLNRIHPSDRERLMHSIDQTGKTLSILDMELTAYTANGEVRWLRSISQPRRLDDGSTIWDGIFLDITEQRSAENRAHHLVMHDRITGLPNVVTFEERLAGAITNAAAENTFLVVGALDVSRFYTVNESLGFQQGDDALRKIGARLQSIYNGNDIVARYEGDEFLFMAQNLPTSDSVRRLGYDVTALFDEPLELDDGALLSVSVKVGLSVFPDDADSPDGLRRAADLALQRVRKDPDRNFEFYSAKMRQDVLEAVTLERELKQAIKDGAIVPHYQPQFDTENGNLCGLEVLARWPVEQGGMVSPGRFIPLAEETGLIHPLMEHLVDSVLSQISQWHREGFLVPSVAINVSAHQIRHHRFFDWLFEQLSHYDLGIDALTVEITESAFLLDFASVQSILEALANRGVRLSIDDFGTGYSSLSYLSQLPFQELKIDRAFVSEVDSSQRKRAVVKGIIELARALELEVIAEGVETESQLSQLKILGCDSVQGFHLAKPMDGTSLTAMLPPDERKR
ncbi:PAS domain S-box-containing protein/diguanylate cyclase (GGDEF)-like protein [Halospina denitrificans]|uniref:PAS domain S-box-containing protein/diguanylate cyclase (GGDEF)-like protein n=1 Tax=Halospina denitrificans TaxID=332522 RepID=A0A4R7JUN5_9GAMM|nr:bifunctional diguanylate cyclase/phosphodiesterase [Halospina denitrificans]TDT41785.1 PAS domain S-box-containing protein/diguanylate cyclase (GGDEF)-like protein [Halospina denitrificans]